jgi:D-glycerate 3-kinase
MRIPRLAGVEVDDRIREGFSGLDPDAPLDYRELAACLAAGWAARRVSRVGVAGGQGSGKSTLGRLLEAASSLLGRRACLLSLDDFYLTKADRRERAARVHPLFETRGVPGTHDMAACARALEALFADAEVDLPIFDKAADDRSGVRRVRGPFDLVILEGWCIGARAVDPEALANPWNDLEATRDESGAWRRAVQQFLREEYEPVWARLDELVYLEVPSLAAVRRWRLEQEAKHPAPLRMDPAQIDRFVQFYERITEAMRERLPAIADCVVRLGEDHRIESLSIVNR